MMASTRGMAGDGGSVRGISLDVAGDAGCSPRCTRRRRRRPRSDVGGAHRARRPATRNQWAGRLVDLTVDRHQRPLEELERLVDPADAYDGFHRGVNALMTGDASSALEALDAGLALPPGVPNLILPRTGALLLAGRQIEGLAEARALLATRPLMVHRAPQLRPERTHHTATRPRELAVGPAAVSDAAHRNIPRRSRTLPAAGCGPPTAHPDRDIRLPARIVSSAAPDRRGPAVPVRTHPRPPRGRAGGPGAGGRARTPPLMPRHRTFGCPPPGDGGRHRPGSVTALLLVWAGLLGSAGGQGRLGPTARCLGRAARRQSARQGSRRSRHRTGGLIDACAGSARRRRTAPARRCCHRPR